MNEENPSTDRLDAGLNPAESSAFSKLFGVGIGGWFLGVLGVLVYSWPQKEQGGIAAAAIWTFSHGWIAFLFGLLVMIAYGVATRRTVVRAALGYLLPAVVLALLAGICLLIYPDSLLREELLIYLPLVFLFYVFGLLWMKLSERSAPGRVFTRAILPALVGGLVVLAAVAGPVFASDAFRYRDAFQLNVTKAGVQDGVIRLDGSLEIRKPGSYQFSAPRYVWNEAENNEASEPPVEQGEIIWGAAGAPKPDSTGVFPMQIVWRKGVSQSSPADVMPFDNWINIEIRKTDEDNRMIATVSAPMTTP